MRGCVKDEGLMALRRRPSGGGVKPPHAALAEDRRGERGGKGARDASGGDREGERKRIAIEVSKLVPRWHRNWGAHEVPGGVWRKPGYWPGGARHVGDASPVCGFHVERGKASPDTAAGKRWRQGVRSSGGNRKASSTVAGRAFGPTHSSAEASVMEGERRGRVIRGDLIRATRELWEGSSG